MGKIPTAIQNQAPLSKSVDGKIYYVRSHKLLEEMAELSEVLSHLVKGEPSYKKIKGEYADVVKAFKNYSPIAVYIDKSRALGIEKEVGNKALPLKNRKKKRLGVLTKASLNLIASMSVLQKEICKDMVGKRRSVRLIDAYYDVWQDLIRFKNVVKLKRKQVSK